ncbi:MAG TPA: YkgJ family cysteine cluster protein [Kofleriaceae bacterium]|nr:YkgJ family cysteine cluster protein [Kofleriaceae bacterium]
MPPVVYDCRTCGACCCGELDDSDGFADVTPADIARMTRYARSRLHRERFGIDVDRVSTHAVFSEEFGKTCGFLRGTPGERCSCGIYESRPDACRAFKAGSRRCREARREMGMEAAP